MAALELLEKLEDCGVSVLVDREELVLRPASKIPPNLLVDLLELLSQTNIPSASVELLVEPQNDGTPEQGLREVSRVRHMVGAKPTRREWMELERWLVLVLSRR